jgi:hypothetical protein
MREEKYSARHGDPQESCTASEDRRVAEQECICGIIKSQTGNLQLSIYYLMILQMPFPYLPMHKSRF